MVNPRPAGGKTCTLFPEISASARKGQGRQRWRNTGAEKPAEAIVADLGGEGPTQQPVDREDLMGRIADLGNLKRAGERVMESITWFTTRRLRLKVNEEKSKVTPSRDALISATPSAQAGSCG